MRLLFFNHVARIRPTFAMTLALAFLLLVFSPAGYAVMRGKQTYHRVVALTYDDGPHPIYTPKILKILDKEHVKATFFMIGRLMEEHPEIVRDIVRRGHAVGNHTYSHPHDITVLSASQIDTEILKCTSVMEKITGQRSNLFRPPLGRTNSSVISIADHNGCAVILWSVSADNHSARTPEAMAQRVLSRVKPGSIILAHDGRFPMRWKDVKATPLIIKGLKKRGYRFVTIQELMAINSRANRQAHNHKQAR